jgi:hypothetical protein
MSEFKFACPVCGQHMMCDTSQGGSVMECPTCFQKITAPQAPAKDSKFILAGTKVSEKKISVRGFDAATGQPLPEKNFPLALVIGLALVIAAGAAGFFVYRGKHAAPPKPPITADAPVKKTALPKPPPAPPASDTNWMLTLTTNAIPDTPAAGRIHGLDFIIERASFQSGTLTLRQGGRGPVEFGVQINFGGAVAESLSGQTLNVSSDADKAAKISWHWKDATGAVQKDNYDSGYALRLEFGALANNKLPGKIWLCTPDAEKSYLLGSFTADARKPKPKARPKQ